MRSRTTTRGAVLVLTLALALATVGPVAAQDEDEPRFEERENRWVLGNDEITVWFQGKKPLLKVMSTEEGNTSYEFHALRVAEFVDEDGDGAYDEDEAVSFMNLAQGANWDVSTDSGEDWLRVNLTLTDEIRSRGPGLGDAPIVGGDREGNVSLVFHVVGADMEIDVGENTTLLLESGQTKFDFIVSHWDWTDDDEGRLALVANVPGGNGTNVTHVNGTQTVEVSQNGTLEGTVTWQTTATAWFGNGSETVDVVPTVKGEEDDDDGAVQVAWAYNASGFDRLVHDPTMSVQEAEEPDDGAGADEEGPADVPGPSAAVTLALLGAAALTLARRRER